MTAPGRLTFAAYSRPRCSSGKRGTSRGHSRQPTVDIGTVDLAAPRLTYMMRTLRMKCCEILSSVILCSSLVSAWIGAAYAQKVYRCVDSGKTVYSDIPCASAATSSTGSNGTASVEPTKSSPSVTTPVTPGNYSTLYGDWRGQTQFQVTRRTEQVSAAHAVTALTIEISPQGKVTGASPDNGCRILGVASPGLVPTILTLDVSFSGCQYEVCVQRAHLDALRLLV